MVANLNQLCCAFFSENNTSKLILKDRARTLSSCERFCVKFPTLYDVWYHWVLRSDVQCVQRNEITTTVLSI